MTPDVIPLPVRVMVAIVNALGTRACSLHKGKAGQGRAGQGKVARWLALTGTGQRRRGYSACGVPIKITRTTYVASWKVDCCAVYPKTWWPGNASGLSNDWVVLPILLLCRNEPFTLAGK
jgi:hypothetical protein